MCVSGEVSRRTQPFELFSKSHEVRFRGLHQMNVGQSEPTFDSLHDILDTKRNRYNFSVGCQADEAEHGSPGKTDAF